MIKTNSMSSVLNRRRDDRDMQIISLIKERDSLLDLIMRNHIIKKSLEPIALCAGCGEKIIPLPSTEGDDYE